MSVATRAAARPRRDSGYLLSGSAAGLAGGLIAGASPVMAAGLAVSVILVLLPWDLLFSVLSFLSITQSNQIGGGGISLNGITIGGVTFRPAMLIIGPFLLRSYLMTNPLLRHHWRLPEYMLLTYLLVATVSTFLFSSALGKSLPTLGLMAFGLVAYYAVYMSVANAERLRKAAFIFLMIVLINALFGLAAAVSHFALHTNIGISTNSAFGPGVFGFSYEHDIFGSTCGAGAVAFFVLWREPNRLMRSRLAGFGFLVCTIAMLTGLARAAWLGYLVAMMAASLLSRRRRSRARFGRTGMILLGGMLILLASSYILFTTQSGTTELTSTSLIGGIKGKTAALFDTTSRGGRGRLGELQTAIADLPESPLIGLGVSTYAQRHPPERVVAATQKLKPSYIGDLWLRSLYEAGALGLLLIVGATALILWPDRALRTSQGSLGPIARALSFGFLVLVVAYAGTDDTLYMWPWIFLGLVRAARVLAAREYRVERAVRSQAASMQVGADGSVSSRGGFARGSWSRETVVLPGGPAGHGSLPSGNGSR